MSKRSSATPSSTTPVRLEFLENRCLLSATVTPILAAQQPTEAVYGSDGLVYFTSTLAPGEIERLNSDQSISTFNAPAYNLVQGHDGNIWFQTSTGLGKLTPGGVISTYSVSGTIGSLTSGLDGKMWFTDDGVLTHMNTDGSRLGRVRLPERLALQGTPTNLAVAADGSAYFETPWGMYYGSDGATRQLNLVEYPGPNTYQFFEGNHGRVWLAKPTTTIRGFSSGVVLDVMTRAHQERQMFTLRSAPTTWFSAGSNGTIVAGEGSPVDIGPIAGSGNGQVIDSAGLVTPFSLASIPYDPHEMSVSPNGDILFAAYIRTGGNRDVGYTVGYEAVEVTFS